MKHIFGILAVQVLAQPRIHRALQAESVLHFWSEDGILRDKGVDAGNPSTSSG